MLKRSALREIKAGLGRYLAMIAIIALGVGFFAGLRSSRPAMVSAGQRYLDETRFFDYRLVSTMGYDESAPRRFSEFGTAEGSVSVDVLCDLGSGSEALHAMTVTESLNLVTLKAGRMPEAADEIIADSERFTEADIGRTITLSSENDEDTLDMFAFREYTITGLGMSPLYMNYERGGTSLGSGQLEGFICLLPEGFDTDYYTEIYLRLDDGAAAYTDEHEIYADSMEPGVTAAAEEEAGARYGRVVAEAEQEIADGEADLADGWEEYRTERADAEAELAEAYQDLIDGRAELDDGWDEYHDGVETFEREIAEAEQEIADAETELADGYDDLLDGEEEYANGVLALDVGDMQFQAGLDDYLDGVREYEESKEAYESGKADLEAAEQELIFARSRLRSGEADLAEGEAQFDTLMSALAGALAQYGIETDPDSLLAALQDGDAQLTAAVDMALAFIGQAGIEGAPANTEELLGMRAQLDAADEQLSAGWSEYRAGEREYERAVEQMESAEEALEIAEARIDSAKQQLDEAYGELGEGLAELYDARYALETGWQDYYDGVQELADAKETLETERADGEAELAEALQELEDGEADLASGWSDYNDGLAEAQQEFADAESDLAEAQRDIDDAKAELADLDEPQVYVLGRDTNVGYVCFENDSAIVEGLSGVFPIFFFLVAALVCMTTMTRMVEDHRTQTGVLKALGYSSLEIAAQYLFYSGSAALIGSVAGVFAGSAVFPRVIWMAYSIMYGFGGLETSVSPALAAGSVAVSLAGALGVTWLTCRSELREVPAELIRPKAPAAGKRVLLEHVPFVWKRLKFLHKVSIRNLTRYKKRFFMMVLGIGGCTALLLTGYGIDDSIGNLTDFQYGEVTVYDLAVSFTDPLTPESEAEFLSGAGDAISGAVFVHESSAEFDAGGGAKSVNLVVAPDGVDGFVNLARGGEAVPLPGEGEAVINNGLARSLGISVGDTVTVRDSDMNSIELTVSGIFDNYVYNYVYISPASYESAFGECEYKSAWVNVAEGRGVHESSAELLELDGVAAVSVNDDMRDRVDAMMDSMKYIVVMVIVCAGALAFIVLYNLTNINIAEREREIATLKVLGFYPNETASYVFRENMMLTAIGALAGLGLGRALHAFVMSRIVVDMVCFDVRVAPLSYLLAVAWTFGFSIFVCLMMRPRLGRIDMAESLKSIE